MFHLLKVRGQIVQVTADGVQLRLFGDDAYSIVQGFCFEITNDDGY